MDASCSLLSRLTTWEVAAALEEDEDEEEDDDEGAALEWGAAEANELEEELLEAGVAVAPDPAVAAAVSRDGVVAGTSASDEPDAERQVEPASGCEAAPSAGASCCLSEDSVLSTRHNGHTKGASSGRTRFLRSLKRAQTWWNHPAQPSHCTHASACTSSFLRLESRERIAAANTAANERRFGAANPADSAATAAASICLAAACPPARPLPGLSLMATPGRP